MECFKDSDLVCICEFICVFFITFHSGTEKGNINLKFKTVLLLGYNAVLSGKFQLAKISEERTKSQL